MQSRSFRDVARARSRRRCRDRMGSRPLHQQRQVLASAPPLSCFPSSVLWGRLPDRSLACCPQPAGCAPSSSPYLPPHSRTSVTGGALSLGLWREGAWRSALSRAVFGRCPAAFLLARAFYFVCFFLVFSGGWPASPRAPPQLQRRVKLNPAHLQTHPHPHRHRHTPQA